MVMYFTLPLHYNLNNSNCQDHNSNKFIFVEVYKFELLNLSEVNKMFKENFIKICNVKGIPPTVACRDIGLSAAAFTKWDDSSVPRRATLQKFSDYFGVSVDYLLGKEEGKNPTTETGELKEDSKRIIHVPVYEKLGRFDLVEASGVPVKPVIERIPNTHFRVNSVAASIPFSSIYDELEYEEYRADPGSEEMYTAIRLHDDSMSPRMMPGDVVIVKLQKTLNDGDVAVLCPDDVAICRKIKKTPEGILLLATNQAYEPIFCPGADLSSGKVRVIGIVAELRAKFE